MPGSDNKGKTGLWAPMHMNECMNLNEWIYLQCVKLVKWYRKRKCNLDGNEKRFVIENSKIIFRRKVVWIAAMST